MRINDAVFGAVLLLFAAAMIWHTRTFPGMPGQDYGPALFPTLIGIGFMITGLILVVTGLRRRRAAEPWFAGGDWLRSKRELGGFLAVVLGLLFYILASGWLGFVPTSVLLLTAWLVTFRGGHWVSSAAIAVAVTLAVNYAFTQHLLVPLPLGLLQPIIY